MRILITGGLGFIGSHLAGFLHAQNHELVILDDLSTGKREHAPAGSTVIIGDAAHPGIFDALLDKGVDACFHLAAIASVEQSNNHWLRAHQVNLGGLVNLLDTLARRKETIPVVFASSAAVYGDSSNLPLSESDMANPISAYGADKLACEMHAHIAQRLHHIPIIGLRFFNVYGERQDPASPYSGVISLFAKRALENKALTIYGDGKQSRDFIYVGDVVQAMAQSLARLQSGAPIHGIYNVCSGDSTTIEGLAQTITAIAGVPAQLTHAPARTGDIRHSLGNPGMARHQLGFEASTALRDGLQKTIEWMKTAL